MLVSSYLYRHQCIKTNMSKLIKRGFEGFVVFHLPWLVVA